MNRFIIIFSSRYFIAFLVAPQLFFSQQRVIDSLENRLNVKMNDTTRVLLLDNLCVRYQNNAKYEKSISLGNEGLTLAKKINYLRGIADVYNDMANSYYLKGDYNTAIEHHLPAIEIRLQLKQDIKLARSYNNLGSTYERIGDYNSALDYHFKSLKIKERLGDSVGIQKSYNNLGNLNLILRNFDKALELYLQSFEMAKRLKNEGQLAMTLDNIASVYDETGDFNKALEYELASLKISQKIEDKYMIGVNYTNLAGIYNNLKQEEQSKQYYLKALKSWEEDENEDGIASVCINLGQHYYKIDKNYKTAAKYLERSLKYTQHKSTLSETYLSLSELYERIGDHKTALSYASQHIQLQKELFNENVTAQLTEVQTKYETEKKEKENLELKTKNELQKFVISNEQEKRKTQLIISLAVIALITGLAYFLYYRRKLKHKAILANELAKQDKVRFRAIIEAEEKERSRIAQDLHDGLGQMLAASRMHVGALRNFVSETEKNFAAKALEILNDAYNEVRNISHNMMPNALMRLGLVAAIKELVGNINAAKVLRIDFNTNVEGSLGKSMDITIYRIVQEVLNNMMKHAQADHIVMEITKEKENLNISISDNGIGFDTSLINESKGLGWKGIYSRVSMLDGTIKLDSILKKGTIIYINLKLKEGS
jgi:two-component system, NarL family, sensor kinase